MSEHSRYRVFVSYSPEDTEWAGELAAALREGGTNAWFDESELLPGDDWRARVQEALRESRVLVLVVGQTSRLSPSMSFHLGAAIADDKRIIPVLREDVAPEQLPPMLSRYRFLREPSARHAAQRIAETLTKLDAA